MQMLGQRGVIAGGILIEQPAQIRFGHGGRPFRNAKSRQLQARAMIVVRIGAARIVERGHGAGAIGKPIADRTKREPCRGKSGAASTVCARISAAAMRSPRTASSTAAL